MKSVRETRKVPRVRLELTEGEADFLLGLMGRIGGDPVNSPRKYQKRVMTALTKALGYSYDETDAFKLVSTLGGGNVLFDNYPEETDWDFLTSIIAKSVVPGWTEQLELPFGTGL